MRLHRWGMALQQLDLIIEHVAGDENHLADLFTRWGGATMSESTRQLSAMQQLQPKEERYRVRITKQKQEVQKVQKKVNIERRNKQTNKQINKQIIKQNTKHINQQIIKQNTTRINKKTTEQFKINK